MLQAIIPKRHNGAVLIILVLIIALTILTYTLGAFNSKIFQSRQDVADSSTLADAKNALIGFTLNVSSGSRPGNMPLPDYFASTESPANYDGLSDSGCMDSSKSDGLPLISAGANMRCLGRLPWQTIGMSISSPTQNDPIGDMPWYAVSANLVDPTCLNLLNPDLLTMTYSSYICGSTTNLPHPWLTVRDSRGNILSNRVAFVLFLPGKPIDATSQPRPTSSLAGVGSYLDTFTVAAGCSVPCVPGTYSNADLDDDYIMAAGLTGTDANSVVNDRILYVTIDDLMPILVKRAGMEARKLLNAYKSQNGQFPYAAPLGSTATLNDFVSSGTSTSGMVPIDATDSCTCTSAISCTCGFGPIANVAYKRSSTPTWSSKSGSCTFPGATSNTCTCTGAGSCSGSGARSFTCIASGSCTATSNAPGSFTFTPPTYADIHSASTGCSLSSGNAVCIASGTFTIGLNEASWFSDNHWQEFFYYLWSSSSDLQVGSHAGISALLVGTGAAITTPPYAVKNATQTRPSSNINDYLDSTENINGDNIFDATQTSTSSNYNDQSIIVAP